MEKRTANAFDDWRYAAARGGLIWGQEIDVFGVKDGSRWLAQCKDWRAGEITPATLWRLIAIAQTIEARPLLVTTAELSRNAEQIARRWGVPIVRPVDLEREPGVPVAGHRLGLPPERRWSSRLNDGGEMRELLLRGVHPRRESRPSY
ncbi:restriction endonuclease [Halomicrobium sp. LC1Hm]|uniref:restriction endonuclease n=1 Tax=Halomicrobium sp. LC1Hm TaxID=2610902 RepID=UPI0012983DE3|nr:restriction endonuclease [Halomicrobium sp. LC1Hm]QGA81992.1 putative endonuclease of PD-DExK superfamily [Halomicrobium sp. LC1Hm]